MMEITTKADDFVTILKIAGRIDFATSESLEHASTAVIEDGSSRIIFDMREIHYVSSAGLRAILMAARKARSVGGGVAVFGLQPGVEVVFTTSGFGKIVPVVSSDSDARKMLSA